MNITTQPKPSAGDSSTFEHLFSPFKLGHLELRNRVVWLPHLTAYAGDDGFSNDRHLHYYEARARGGVGLIITGCQTAHPAAGWPGRINAYDPGVVPSYRKLTEAVHRHGTGIIGQITDDGNQADGVSGYDWFNTHAPSVVVDPMVQILPQEMDQALIDEVVDYFARSAENHKEGGFDGVEIKVGHDGLHRQFLSPQFNQRTDEYGGSHENRLRFLRETVEEIRRRVGDEFLVGVRLSLDEGLEAGYGADDGVEFARLIGTWGTIDYLDADMGSTGNLPYMNPDMRWPFGFTVEMTSRAREASGLPTIVAGRIKTPEFAEDILDADKADLIGMARPLITDADWVQKAQSGQTEDIRSCIACNQGCLGRLWAGMPITCILNPSAGREEKWGEGSVVMVTEPQDVVVIGGGPAGLKAAELAALRGHRVSIYDRSSHLGGQVNTIVKLPVRREFHDSTAWIQTQIERLEVNVRLGWQIEPEMIEPLPDGRLSLGARAVSTPAPPASIEAIEADRVIVATGSIPVAAPFAGSDRHPVLSIPEAYDEVAELGEHVVVWDEELGQPAASTAELLAERGHRVTIVTPAAHPAVKVVLPNKPSQLQRLSDLGVEVIPYHAVNDFADGSLTIANAYSGREQTLEDVDGLVYALGWRADEDLYLTLREHSDQVVRAGDCIAPRDVGMAIYSGERIGREV